MTIEFAARSDVGHQRDHNEDYFIADEDLGLFVMCDGMGGHAAGEVASETAATKVRDALARNLAVFETFDDSRGSAGRAELADLVTAAVQEACEEVHRLAQSDPGKAGMGTTLVMVVVANHVGFMAHVGDSRLYLKRGGNVHQLTEDHSFVNEMVRAGRLSPEEARQSPYASVITRAVGTQPTVKVDTLTFDILPGDTLLLCSDGLSDYLEDEAELATLLTDGPLRDHAERLIELANDRGGKDNITAVLVRGLPDVRPKRRDAVHALGLKMETLRRVRLFRRLEYKELVQLLDLTSVETHEAGSALITEGKGSVDFHIVLDGSVEVTQQGRQLAKLSQGDHLGEMELVMGLRGSATVTTTVPTEILTIRRKDFIALLKANEQIAVKLMWNMLQSMSLRLHATSSKLAAAIDPNEASAPF